MVTKRSVPTLLFLLACLFMIKQTTSALSQLPGLYIGIFDDSQIGLKYKLKVDLLKKITVIHSISPGDKNCQKYTNMVLDL